jgi:hypothetical protein
MPWPPARLDKQAIIADEGLSQAPNLVFSSLLERIDGMSALLDCLHDTRIRLPSI